MRIKLGIIGTGMAFERLHYPALLELQDKYEIIGMANRTRQTAESYKAKFNLSCDIYENYQDLLARNDLDAVLTALPIPENYQVNRAVIERGCGLIAEKPIAADPDQAEQLTELAAKRGVKVLVAENYRFAEENMFMRDIIKQRRIGDVLYFVQNNAFDFKQEMKNDTFAAKEWRQHPAFKGKMLLDAGVHDIARMRYLFGNVNSVYASGIEQEEDWNAYKVVNAQLGFDSGVTGQYNFCCDTKELTKPSVGFRVFGTEGEIFLESKDSGHISVSYSNGNTENIDFVPDRGYYNEFSHFHKVLTEAEQSRCSPELETGDIKTVFNIIHSISNNKVVVC